MDVIFFVGKKSLNSKYFLESLLRIVKVTSKMSLPHNTIGILSSTRSNSISLYIFFVVGYFWVTLECFFSSFFGNTFVLKKDSEMLCLKIELICFNNVYKCSCFINRFVRLCNLENKINQVLISIHLKHLMIYSPIYFIKKRDLT